MAHYLNYEGRTWQPILRPVGVTSSERYLNSLSERAFLSLWSYPGVYRDQGIAGSTKEGKEVCDLLVVFGKHVILFSDKECKFPNSSDVKIDWLRWFKKAVTQSADQIRGAERWIRDHPERLYLDRACTIPFPVKFPTASEAIFHRIVVAHGASERCKQELGGSGSLMLSSEDSGNTVNEPFTIGSIENKKGFIHVLDDVSLDILLSTLDTVTDFVDYLYKKEELFSSDKLVKAAGEEELLATYLANFDANGKHTFGIDEEFKIIVFNEGCWIDFASGRQRTAQMEADRISYDWDGLIEKFNFHILADTQYYASDVGFGSSEKIMRVMAREPRLRRRILAERLLDAIYRTPPHARFSRIIPPTKPEDPFYIFLILPRKNASSYNEYREVRRELLAFYCRAVKIRYPEATEIVGIATEDESVGDDRTEDSILIDTSNWQEEFTRDTQRIMNELDIFTHLTESRYKFKEYPDSTPCITPIPKLRSCSGNRRNHCCPCGSGHKYKHCHGR